MVYYWINFVLHNYKVIAIVPSTLHDYTMTILVFKFINIDSKLSKPILY